MDLRRWKLIVALAAAADLGSTPPLVSALSWEPLPTNSRQQFRGLSALSDKVVWVSGTNATVLRTADGGATWQSVGPALSGPDAELQLRDVEVLSSSAWPSCPGAAAVLDDSRVVALSIGEGTDSRVYTTLDRGVTWDLAFTNAEPAAFYNCLAFTGPSTGFALSDPVDGAFRLAETRDGGVSWAVVVPAVGGMPPPFPGEFAFSASGTCLTTTRRAGGPLFFGSGGVAGRPGRVFRSAADADARAWTVADTTIPGAEGSGVFSVQFTDGGRHGIALGGDFTAPNATEGTAAFSTDGGETWRASAVFPGGYRSGASWVPGFCGVALAVGPTGSDITVDGGRTWRLFDNTSLDAVQCLPGGVCWASGAGGRVARLTLEPRDLS